MSSNSPLKRLFESPKKPKETDETGVAEPPVLSPVKEQPKPNKYANAWNIEPPQSVPDSPAPGAGPAKSVDLGLQNAGPASPASPARPARPRVSKANQEESGGRLDLMKSLPSKKGFTKQYHQLTDLLYGHLSAYEQLVHMHLFRLSWGNGNPTCFIGMPRLAERCKISPRSAHEAVKSLINKGLIEKVEHKFGKGIEQGLVFYVQPPPSHDGSAGGASPAAGASLARNAGPARPADIKEEELKEIHTHNTERDEDGESREEKNRVGVGAVSKYSIEECKRYAEHLRATGQGITNPGGYATTIHRTGEADALIEKFLNPSAATQVDAAQCPDCRGSGFYYPKGHEGGVAKCRHEKMVQ
ncbi:MAG TPA: helix-turn-helix domain-containing protein [Pyrinomonadaceae bacterium]|jgi:hypothetical protein